jgi:hypothetical protein
VDPPQSAVRQGLGRLWGWCLRANILFFFLIPVSLYAMQRAYHYGEGFWEFVGYHFIDLLTIHLALSGIGYAWNHDREMREQSKAVEHQLEELKKVESFIGEELIQLKDQARELKRLEGSLSTYRKGPFPQYLNEIGKLAATATHLDVLVDGLDYGSFFAPTVHKDVHSTICKVAQKPEVRVRILVCGMPEPLTGPSGQTLNKYANADALLKDYTGMLDEDKGFKAWIKTLGSSGDGNLKAFAETWLGSLKLEFTKALLDACISVCSGGQVLTTSSQDAPLFKTLLQLRQLWFARDLHRFGVDIRAQAVTEPMFVWIKYENEPQSERDITDDALFTFSNAARGPGQLGYSTHDPDLLNTFRAMFEEKWNEADPQKNELPWLKFLQGISCL